MNYLAVDLYHDFECIADACPNTCCAGWSITIDASTHKKMIECEQQLGIPAEEWLMEHNGSIIAKLKDHRCPMLNDSNLCHVVLKLGPEYLSDTCKQYPRRFRQYGNMLEMHLTMSCPDVIVKLMDKESVQFDFFEDKHPASQYPYANLYLFESAVRTNIIDVLQAFPDISLSTRLFAAFNILDKAIQLYQKKGPDLNLLQQDIYLYSQKNTLLSLEVQLHSIVNESSRYTFLQQLQAIISTQGTYGRFGQLTLQTYDYFHRTNQENYLSDLILFRESIKEYNNFYTNYWVYRIFSDTLVIPNYELSKEKLLYIAMEFCYIQTMALASFANQKKLDRNEYIYIISYISRQLEHNQTLRQQLIGQLNGNNIVNAAGLLLMILI